MLVRALVVTLAFPAVCFAQDPDPQLIAYSFRAIDNHAHVVVPDVAHDQDFDALRCDTLSSTGPLPPANTRFGPDLQAAWQALYNVSAESSSPDNLARWQAAQRATREKHGAAYFDWVLLQAGVDVVLANRVTMARELGSAHFR
jgi:hypothetical protein